jgi:hypothetical protein
LSKREEASLRILRAVLVRRMLTLLKLAASSRTLVVLSDTSLSAPPMTPARATASDASAIASMSGSNRRCTPSSVVSGSPGRARRTMIFPPPIRSKSKACRGCPTSSMT